jgi:hypothetical protein
MYGVTLVVIVTLNCLVFHKRNLRRLTLLLHVVDGGADVNDDASLSLIRKDGNELGLEQNTQNGVSLFRARDIESLEYVNIWRILLHVWAHQPVITHRRHRNALDSNKRNLSLQGSRHNAILLRCDHNMNGLVRL